MKIDILANRYCNTRRLISREAALCNAEAVAVGGNQSRSREYALAVGLDGASYAFRIVGKNDSGARNGCFRRILHNTGNTAEARFGLAKRASYIQPSPNKKNETLSHAIISSHRPSNFTG